MIEWPSLDAFLDASGYEKGLHAVRLGDPDDTVYEFYLDPQPGTPLLAHFHGNAPRGSSALPVITGHGVTRNLSCSLFVPSDPTLRLSDTLSLAWHAGTRTLALTPITGRILDALRRTWEAPHVVAWGGSGGGFAALRVARELQDCIAFVWNPQTAVSEYVESFVAAYIEVAFEGRGLEQQSTGGPRLSAVDHLRVTVPEFWSGYRGEVFYFQERSDWHMSRHLAPVLGALDPDRPIEAGPFTGVVADRFWLHVGDWGPGHAPLPKAIVTEVLGVLARTGLSFDERTDALRSVGERTAAVRALVNRIERVPQPARPLPEDLDLGGDALELPLLTTDMFAVHRTHGVDWDRKYESQAASNRMWLYSIAPVADLVASHEAGRGGALVWADVIVRSFLEKSAQPGMFDEMAGLASGDHSAATRVKSLVLFLQAIREFADVDVDFVVEVTQALLRWSAWIMDDANFRMNNHGLMGAIALLLASQHFAGTSYAEPLAECANGRIHALASMQFDVDGLCNENSIGYHNYNLHLYRELLQYLLASDPESSLALFIGDVVERGTTALRQVVWQDGRIPPIGDSSAYPSKVKPINAPKAFPESGLAVVKDAEMYLSFVCGAPSETHKQCDDTSITLRMRGVDILVDAGAYLYDRGDPYRRAIESPRGHSGVGPLAWDGLIRPELIAVSPGLCSRLVGFDRAGASTRMRGVVEAADGRIIVDRSVLVRPSEEVVIVDRVHLPDGVGEPGALQRFLFGPDVRLTIDEDGARVELEAGDVRGTLWQLGRHHVEEHRGIEGPEPRGWCSFTFGKKQAASSLEFTQHTRSARFASVLTLRPTERLDKCSDEALAFAHGVHEPIASVPGGEE